MEKKKQVNYKIEQKVTENILKFSWFYLINKQIGKKLGGKNLKGIFLNFLDG